MAGKRAKKDKEKPQIERFKEAAKSIGASDDSAYEKAMDKILPKRSADYRYGRRKGE
jgi:hypothetical protein